MLKRIDIPQLKDFLKYLGVTLSLIFLYTALSALWTPLGIGIRFDYLIPQFFKIELPLVAAFLSLLYFPKIKRKTIKYIIPTFPILIFYLIFDIFYQFFQRTPRFSDLQNAPSLLEFDLGLAIKFLLVSSTILLSLFLLIHQAKRAYPPKNWRSPLLYRIILIVVFIFSLQTDIFVEHHNKSYNVVSWSNESTITINGKISSFIFYDNYEKENWKLLKKYAKSKLDINSKLYPGAVVHPRNIHFIVLESFIDPRLLENIQFSRSPLADELLPYIHDSKKDFSRVISPIYGGGTAQAEFELLVGIEALAKIRSSEFNVMKGGAISSFVNRLAQYGYNSVATIASGPEYFNSKQAYKSLGFDEVLYLTRENEFKEKANDFFIFDGDLLDFNLKKISALLEDNKKPIVNYVLGMYGHTPFKRNKKLRPDIIHVENGNEKVQRISNQFYYRTKAIAKYIDQILSIDPTSIIYITSDHLPHILESETRYLLEKHSNIALFLDGGHPLDVSGKRYFEIPWLTWRILSETNNSRTVQNEEMEQIYFTALAESISNN